MRLRLGHVTKPCARECEIALEKLTPEQMEYNAIANGARYFRDTIEAVRRGDRITKHAIYAAKDRLIKRMETEHVPERVQAAVTTIITDCIGRIKSLPETAAPPDIAAVANDQPPEIADTMTGEKVAIDIRAGSNGNGINGQLVHQSEVMAELLKTVDKVAPKDIPVAIYGETGTGKELISRLMHQQSSQRSAYRFAAINCAAIPEMLLESELFGHRKGAFTGAHADKEGLFTSVGKGTIFLDEIGEMSPALQAKLLRIFDSGEYTRIGDPSNTMQSQARIVTATNRNLRQDASTGKFRSDLYFRLGFPITVPPLRERADIQPLAEHLTRKFDPTYTLSPDCIEKLKLYSFPGNVRELANAIQCALVVCDHKTLTWKDIRRFLAEPDMGK